MHQQEFNFRFDVYDSIHQLNEDDAILLQSAINATGLAYAPYSHFKVGAAARLINKAIVVGSNQENASFPAGVCAERNLLGTLASLFPNVLIENIAISYKNREGTSNHPISPCGICRQSLSEYEQRFAKPIRLLLGGIKGKIFILPSVSLLLPLSFTAQDLAAN